MSFVCTVYAVHMYSLVIDMDIQSQLSLHLWKKKPSFLRSLSSLLRYCHHDVLWNVLRLYFITIYYNIQTCFNSIAMMPHVLNSGTIWHAPEIADRQSYWLTDVAVNERQSYNRRFMYRVRGPCWNFFIRKMPKQDTSNTAVLTAQQWDLCLSGNYLMIKNMTYWTSTKECLCYPW